MPTLIQVLFTKITFKNVKLLKINFIYKKVSPKEDIVTQEYASTNEYYSQCYSVFMEQIVVSLGVMTMGNKKIIFAQFSKIVYSYDPETMKKLGIFEKECKDVKYLPIFSIVSKLNIVSVCEVMKLVTNRVWISMLKWYIWTSSSSSQSVLTDLMQILIVMTPHLLRLNSRHESRSIL